MKKIIFITLFLIALPIFSEDVFKFFEFSPRSTDFFILRNSKITQKFIPFNDYLSIIGLWLENQEPTSIKLSIFDPENNLIFEKNFVIPKIEPNWWGEEYLLPLNENFLIRSGGEYKLILEGLENNNLKIFTKNLLEIIQGSENYLYFPETLRPLEYNNESTNYTLKLSLYEGKENKAPVLDNLRVNIISPRSVKISFNANEPIKYSLFYKKTLEKNFSSTSIDYFIGCFPNIRDCLIELTVEPQSEYLFEIKAEDFWGNFSKLEGKFITPIEETLSTNTQPVTTLNEPSLSFREETSYPFNKKTEIKEKINKQDSFSFNFNFKQPLPLLTSTLSYPLDQTKNIPTSQKEIIISSQPQENLILISTKTTSSENKQIIIEEIKSFQIFLSRNKKFILSFFLFTGLFLVLIKIFSQLKSLIKK